MTDGPTRPGRTWLLRTALESLAVVLSILLAFAIDAGWDERQDRREEVRILESLELEFERYAGDFARLARFYGTVGEQIVWLLDEAEFTPPEVDRLDEAMLAFVGAPTFDATSGVHSELTASGRISLISNLDLRRRVSTWGALLVEATDNEAVVREYAGSVMVPFLASRGVPIDRVSRVTHSSGWQLRATPATDAVDTYREVVGEPEFRALAAWRYEWALRSASGYRRARQAADSAVVLVREAMER